MRTHCLLAARRSLLSALLGGALLAACGPGGNPDVVTEAGDVVADAPPPDAPPLDATDAGLDAALDATADAPAETGGDADDAGRVSFISSVHVNTLMQDCMPIVPPDPLQFSGTLDLMNTGTLPVGPVMASEAIVAAADGHELARFAIEPVTLAVVAPGAMGSVMVAKRAGTLMPAMGCTAVPCGMLARVRLPITGPNVPPGTIANSPLTTVMCAL